MTKRRPAGSAHGQLAEVDAQTLHRKTMRRIGLWLPQITAPLVAVGDALFVGAVLMIVFGRFVRYDTGPAALPA